MKYLKTKHNETYKIQRKYKLSTRKEKSPGKKHRIHLG